VLAKRSAARNSQGDLLSLVDGGETDQELKDLVVQLALKCPQNNAHFQCPFRILGGLSYTSMNSIVQTMSRKACLSLFELERECRVSYAADCQSIKKQEV
jgi:hypothetical protein